MEKENTEKGYFKQTVQPFIWGAIMGAVVMSGFWIGNHTPANRIASSPNRIIPAARDMAKGALNPDKLEVRVCDALPDQPGNELIFKYNNKMQIVTIEKDGETFNIEPYKGESWRCY